MKVEGEHLDEWIDIQVIGRSTAVVVKLIYYPCIVVALMILARIDLFDRWDWPPSLLIVLGANLVYAAYCGWKLRSAAEKARRASLEALDKKLLEALGTAAPKSGTESSKSSDMKSPEEPGTGTRHNERTCEQLRTLIRMVKECREGAFAPWTDQPLIRAIVMPFGAGGLVTLLNYLAG